MFRSSLLPLLALLALPSLPARAQSEPEPEPPEEKAPAAETSPAKPAADAPAPHGDPFARLKRVTPKDKLPPLISVRVRDKREAATRKGTITVTVNTQPKGASVYYGGKLLGATPLGLTAPRGSTPFDVVIRRGGYMTLHTRLQRRVTRGYFFKLTPAKLH